MYAFEGVLSRLVVPPRGANGFGWDTIFQPDSPGSKTLAEMTSEEKSQCSMRKRAVEGLLRHLAVRRASLLSVEPLWSGK